MAAEGGTEYGHMITYARSDSPWGPFVNYQNNPVLTNRNKAPYIIQGIGHGDLIQYTNGDWFILSLGFRQIHIWQPYHHLGREVFLTPVQFGEDGWFTAGTNGVTEWEYEIKGDFEQIEKKNYTFENTKWNLDWVYLRHPVFKNYELSEGKAVLHGTDITLDMVDTPTFLGIRQRDFNMDFVVDIIADKGEAGVTMYMCENEHYDIAIRENGNGFEAVLKLNIGDIKHVQSTFPLSENKARLIVRADNHGYKFFVSENGKETGLGYGSTKYLSSEVSGGFTGVVMGLYAVGNNTAEFTKLNIEYFENKE